MSNESIPPVVRDTDQAAIAEAVGIDTDDPRWSALRDTVERVARRVVADHCRDLAAGYEHLAAQWSFGAWTVLLSTDYRRGRVDTYRADAHLFTAYADQIDPAETREVA